MAPPRHRQICERSLTAPMDVSVDFIHETTNRHATPVHAAKRLNLQPAEEVPFAPKIAREDQLLPVRQLFRRVGARLFFNISAVPCSISFCNLNRRTSRCSSTTCALSRAGSSDSSKSLNDPVLPVPRSPPLPFVDDSALAGGRTHRFTRRATLFWRDTRAPSSWFISAVIND